MSANTKKLPVECALVDGFLLEAYASAADVPMFAYRQTSAPVQKPPPRIPSQPINRAPSATGTLASAQTSSFSGMDHLAAAAAAAAPIGPSPSKENSARNPGGSQKPASTSVVSAPALSQYPGKKRPRAGPNRPTFSSEHSGEHPSRVAPPFTPSRKNGSNSPPSAGREKASGNVTSAPVVAAPPKRRKKPSSLSTAEKAPAPAPPSSSTTQASAAPRKRLAPASSAPHAISQDDEQSKPEPSKTELWAPIRFRDPQPSVSQPFVRNGQSLQNQHVPPPKSVPYNQSQSFPHQVGHQVPLSSQAHPRFVPNQQVSTQYYSQQVVGPGPSGRSNLVTQSQPRLHRGACHIVPSSHVQSNSRMEQPTALDHQSTLAAQRQQSPVQVHPHPQAVPHRVHQAVGLAPRQQVHLHGAPQPTIHHQSHMSAAHPEIHFSTSQQYYTAQQLPSTAQVNGPEETVPPSKHFDVNNQPTIAFKSTPRSEYAHGPPTFY